MSTEMKAFVTASPAFAEFQAYCEYSGNFTRFGKGRITASAKFYRLMFAAQHKASELSNKKRKALLAYWGQCDAQKS